jgi:segregation and condensation protein B
VPNTPTAEPEPRRYLRGFTRHRNALSLAYNARMTQTQDTPTQHPDAAAADELALGVEAALLTCDRALTSARLAELLKFPGAGGVKPITQAIAALNAVYEETGRSFRIEQVAGGWQLMTLPRFAAVLQELHKARTQSKLTPAQMETLAIIAYKQPILRADIEAIRGVACGEVVRALMERHLVKIVGRAEEIGRPMLYGTTKYFLEIFGLSSLKDLPKAEELKPTPARGSAPVPGSSALESPDDAGESVAQGLTPDAKIEGEES